MKYLDDVPDNNSFVLGNRKILNLHGLLYELRNMDENSFSHYASDKHNYFSDWVEHVIKHVSLAKNMRKASSRQDLIKIIEKEIKKLSGDDLNSQKKKESKGDKIKSTVKETREIEQIKDKPEIKQARHPDEILSEISENEKEIKDFLWKHFAWDMAKEFMYGMAIGILIGYILSKILM